MTLQTEAIQERIDALLATCDSDQPSDVLSAYHGTVTLLQLVRGAGSAHERHLDRAAARAEQANMVHHIAQRQLLIPAIEGALRALAEDIKGGLVASISAQAAGQELADLLQLGKRALEDGREGSKNVASVLVAAAFEDTIRRLAQLKAGVQERPKLEEVLGALRAAGIVTGAALSTASGYLSFRNNALHADWGKVDNVVVGSCAAFVEGLLLKHFT